MVNFQNYIQWPTNENKNLVEDHPMNIDVKFGSILFSDFREEDLNVKS
jgi:hypothetical protein